MANDIVREEKLILADGDANSNKFWFGRLYSNGDVEAEWGRVGKKSQSKRHANVGSGFLDKKLKEKERKGYSLAQVISGTGGGATPVGDTDLKQVAADQIQTGDALADKLVKNLVTWNVHQIKQSTSIAYDDTTGLFSTPLGVITQGAIDDARTQLSTIQDCVADNDWESKVMRQSVDQFLRLVPEDIGMKFNRKTLFPDNNAVLNRESTLQSLESSLATLSTRKDDDDGKGKKTKVEKVFDVEMSAVSKTSQEFDHIKKFYEATMNRMHACYGMKLIRLYNLKIGFIDSAFQIGKKVGNCRELWHGTGKANLLSIIRTGLKCAPPSTAKIAGKMFGNGLYFSDQSTKSLNYAYGYWHGGKGDPNCFMLVCDVAMGKEYVPSGGWGRNNYPLKGYDSTFAKARTSGVQNNEMIVYKDNQVNMSYLAEFSR